MFKLQRLDIIRIYIYIGKCQHSGRVLEISRHTFHSVIELLQKSTYWTMAPPFRIIYPKILFYHILLTLFVSKTQHISDFMGQSRKILDFVFFASNNSFWSYQRYPVRPFGIFCCFVDLSKFGV